MDEIAIRRLKAAGWTPSRKADISRIEKAYADAGMQIPPKLREFFLEFSGLSVEFGKGGGNVRPESHYFDPSADFRNHGRGDFARLLEDWGVFGPVFPVGFAHGGEMGIYFSEGGFFYLFMEGGPLVRCGNTAESLVGGLCGDDSARRSWSHFQEPPFAGVVLGRLAEAGWSLEYEADISPIEKAYSDAGMQIPPKLREFFLKFGLLSVEYDIQHIENESHYFNPCFDFQNYGREDFAHFFDDYGILGCAYPVGSACRGNMTIYFHDDGNFYLYMGGGPLIRCGNTAKSLLDGLLGGDDGGWEYMSD